MMGWLTPHRAGPEARTLYRGAQCGLCHHLGQEHGLVARLAAGPDLVAYRVFLDVVAGVEAPLDPRPCVLTPWARPLPARGATEGAALAAAFGLWMGVEKALDDWRDEGRVLGWLAARVLREPGARARQRLEQAGFPVAEVQGWLQAQANLERQPHADLEQAMAPTRAIGRLSFGFAARGRPELRPAAEQVGDALARWLYWVDGLLDWPRDVAAGRYNPLARSLAGAPPALPPEALRQQALAAADAALDELSDALRALPVGTLGAALLRAVLVHGPRDRLQRLAALPPSTRNTARDLLPPPPPLAARLDRGLRALALRLRRSRVRFRLQAAVALWLAWIFPSRAWGQAWWPEAPLDTGVPPELLAPVDPGAVDLAPGSDAQPVTNDPNAGDACVNNWGFCDFDACCGSVCDPVCDDVCEPDCSCDGGGDSAGLGG